MSTPVVGRILGCGALAVAALALAACAPLVACPAIGWSNTIEVRTIATPGIVSSLRVCVESVCATGSTAQVGNPTQLPPVSVASSGNGVWTIRMGMDSPTTVVITAFDSVGGELGTKTAALSWTRVGGTTQCGGPERAKPVELRID